MSDWTSDELLALYRTMRPRELLDLQAALRLDLIEGADPAFVVRRLDAIELVLAERAPTARDSRE